jgi:hypothetical protein
MKVKTLIASLTLTAATMAFVLAIAGMMFLITPRVSLRVTPSIPNLLARSWALLKIQETCSGLSIFVCID